MPSDEMVPFDPADPEHTAWLVDVWNAACPPSLGITERGAAFNTRPAPTVSQAGRFAVQGAQIVGFILASTPPDVLRPDAGGKGYVDAFAVRPGFQHQGIGSRLLEWAQAWLIEQGCSGFRLGGSLRPFAPGLPEPLQSSSFFHQRGYAVAKTHYEWDVAADLSTWDASDRQSPPDCIVRPALPGEEQALLDFFHREFPGRWEFELREALRMGSRTSDYIVVVTRKGIDGFAHLTFEDSYWPLDRVFPHRLPRPWAQLGPLGISARLRGLGYGDALMRGALTQLHNGGVRGCVIDWTDLLDFYARYGFEPYNKYIMLVKTKE